MSMKFKFYITAIIILSSLQSFTQITIEDIVVDTSITGFSFAIDYSGTKVYTPNGPSDLKTKNPTAFSFTLMDNTNYEKAMQQFDAMLKMSIEYGFVQSDLVRKDTVIHGNKSYFISCTQKIEAENYKNLLFYGFQLKGDQALLFVSGDLSDGIYIEGIKKTFFATKLGGGSN